MPAPFYNQNYEFNRNAMRDLWLMRKAPDLNTPSDYPIGRLDLSHLDSISTGALQATIKEIAKKRFPSANKGVHRNEWRYLPGNCYGDGGVGKLTTRLYGAEITVAEDTCMFKEFYFADGTDLKSNIKNSDRRIVYDSQQHRVYLTLVHYDRWVDGIRRADGSPRGNSPVRNPFFQIINL